jgi:hypothetical protein
VADYINLVHRAVPVIRQEYPEARIVAGPAPALYEQACYDYEMAILESDLIMPQVDAVSWHPGPYPQELGGPISHLYQVPQTVLEIQATASAHGFGGEYLPEELNWSTLANPCPTEPWNVYSETVAAKYYARGILDHRGVGLTALVGQTHYHGQYPKMDVIRNLSTLIAGAEPISLPVKIEVGGLDLKLYSFSLPNDSRLIALWRDEMAIEEILPGTPLTMTLPGLAGHHVVGVDTLFSFQQTLATETEGNDLIIHNLLVRDYPLLLRITPHRNVFLPVVQRNKVPGR